MALATSERCCLAWKRSTIWMAPGNCSSARFQIHGAPSPRTTRRSAWLKPRRRASRSARWANAEGAVSVSRLAALSDGGRVADRAGVAHGDALVIASFRGPDRAQLALAR